MRSFKYTHKGVTKTVIDIKPFTKWQYWKTFGLLWAWTAIVIYLITLSAFCPIMINGEVFLDCPYLTVATATPVIMVTIFTFLWSYFTIKSEVRKNHIYKEDQEKK